MTRPASALKDSPPLPPGFASAAKALRAKIRACAARSFAVRHGAGADDEALDPVPDVAAEPALLAGRAIRRPGTGRATGRL